MELKQNQSSTLEGFGRLPVDFDLAMDIARTQAAALAVLGFVRAGLEKALRFLFGLVLYSLSFLRLFPARELNQAWTRLFYYLPVIVIY